MSMMDLTSESLSKAVEQPVPDLYVVIAKNSVVGLDEQSIAEMLGVSLADLQAETSTQLYKDVRLLIASEYARESVDADLNWDSIEQSALKGLAKRVPVTHDTDQLLRIAAVANRAQRRVRPDNNKTLDPRLGGAKVSLQLTDRIVKKLQANGDTTIVGERTVRLTDGSAANPTFQEVDQLLGVRAGALPKVTTHGPDFGIDDLEYKG